jgi:hypothetical protein
MGEGRLCNCRQDRRKKCLGTQNRKNDKNKKKMKKKYEQEQHLFNLG